MKTSETLVLTALLDVLGYTDDEFVSVGHSNGDGRFHTAVGRPVRAGHYVSGLPDRADIYFGVCPVKGPARRNAGRGTVDDVTRLAALWADLDVKPDACANLEVAETIIDELSAMIGTRPSAITRSGNGLHPYWPVSDEQPSVNIAALLRRWGRLVAVVAETHGASVDSVFDLARMLRVPGTHNGKAGASVVTYADDGGPLSVAEIDERLNEFGIYEEPDDTRSDEQISDPDGWTFADETCQYVAEIVGGIPQDGPPAAPKKKGSGRHQWLCSQAVRLTCALRLGCISESDWRRVQKLLDKRLRELRAATGEKVPRYEVANAFKLGNQRTGTKTDEQAWSELGDHGHESDGEAESGNSAGATDSAHPTKIHRGQARFAYLLAEAAAEKLMHVHGLGWHYWDGKRWRRDDKGVARRAVLALNRTQWRKARGDKELQGDCRKCDTATGINGVLEIASALESFAATVEDLDADPYLLNVANGTLDLHTLELKPFSTADRITKIGNGAYDPKTEAPIWNAFLAKVLPDENVRRFVQRLAGQGLLGEVREHILPIFTGSGRNGKSTLYEALLYALGEYAGTADPNLFMHRENAHPTGEMDLLGKRLIVVSENEQGRRVAEATMKRLTGGDRIKARYMRKDFVEFRPSHLPILVTNHLPKVSGDDPAVWARIRVVPFAVVIPESERDTTLGEKLRLEADGVLTWCVEGLRAYLNEGLAEPTSVRAATDNYQQQHDAIGRFIIDCCELFDGLRSTTAQLFDAWDCWRVSDGAEQISRKMFGQLLDRRGYPTLPQVQSGHRWRTGIALRDDWRKFADDE